MRSVAPAIAGVLLASGTWALAGFSNADSATIAIATAALAPPTSLSATAGCAGPLTPDVDLSWTATTSTFGTGYVVRRRLAGGGTYSTIATVGGRTTTTYTDPGPLALDTQYQYVVQSRYASWTTDSTSATATTPLVC